MPVDKLRSVVRIHRQKAEGQHAFDPIQGLLHRHLALPRRACDSLQPLDVGQVQGMGEFSLPRIFRMRDQVDLAEPGEDTSQLSVFTGM
jgi:hypothetical protein